MSDSEKRIYTWRGKDIETLTTEETKEALRSAMKTIIDEREMRKRDSEMRLRWRL